MYMYIIYSYKVIYRPETKLHSENIYVHVYSNIVNDILATVGGCACESADVSKLACGTAAVKRDSDTCSW